MADAKHALDRRKFGLFALVLALAIGGCGDEAEPPGPLTAPSSSQRAMPSEGSGQNQPPAPRGEPTAPAEAPPGDPRRTAAERRERAAERETREVVRAYLAAIDRGDGPRLCELLAPQALAGLELPVRKGGCGASLSASIGYRDPRGIPVFERAELADLRSLELDGTSAKAVATVVTRFADREQASVEDDVIYLTRDGERGRWRVAKASTTLFRALGAADVPPSVIAPPSG